MQKQKEGKKFVLEAWQPPFIKEVKVFSFNTRNIKETISFIQEKQVSYLRSEKNDP